MRIKLLRTIGKKDTLPKTSDNPASLELPFKDDGSMYQEGEVEDFDKEDAEKLIRAGLGQETTDPVGPPPPPAVFGQAPIPVTVVDDPARGAQPARRPHRVEPPETPPGNKDAGPRTDSRGGATGGPPSSGDAPKK
jgi:hypothetical protein